MKSRIGILFLLVLGALQSSYVLHGQTGAERILLEHLKALGGKEKLASISSIVSEGKMTFADNDLELQLRMVQSTGKYLLQLTSDEVEILQGTDGETVWESSPAGVRILNDEERVAAINNNATLFPQLTWADGSFDGEIKLSGRKIVEGANCFVVDFAPTGGARVRRFFDPESFMIRRYETDQKTDSGSLAILVKDSDWRAFEGEFETFKLPFKQQFAADNKLVYTVTRNSIQLNVEVEPEIFDLPDEIKKLKK